MALGGHPCARSADCCRGDMQRASERASERERANDTSGMPWHPCGTDLPPQALVLEAPLAFHRRAADTGHGTGSDAPLSADRCFSRHSLKHLLVDPRPLGPRRIAKWIRREESETLSPFPLLSPSLSPSLTPSLHPSLCPSLLLSIPLSVPHSFSPSLSLSVSLSVHISHGTDLLRQFDSSDFTVSMCECNTESCIYSEYPRSESTAQRLISIFPYQSLSAA